MTSQYYSVDDNMSMLQAVQKNMTSYRPTLTTKTPEMKIPSPNFGFNSSIKDNKPFKPAVSPQINIRSLPSKPQQTKTKYPQINFSFMRPADKKDSTPKQFEFKDQKQQQQPKEKDRSIKEKKIYKKPIPSDRQSRVPVSYQNIASNEMDQTRQINQFIDQAKNNSLVDKLNLLKTQISKTILDRNSIQKEKIKISKQIFYQPTQKLSQFIVGKGKQPNSVIFKAVAMKQGQLYNYVTSDVEIRNQIQYIKQNVINWGFYYIDLLKLQKNSTSKANGNQIVNYQIQKYGLVIQIKTRDFNTVTVYYNSKRIQPHQFQDVVLQQMAVQLSRKRATQIYYKYLKMYSQ